MPAQPAAAAPEGVTPPAQPQLLWAVGGGVFVLALAVGLVVSFGGGAPETASPLPVQPLAPPPATVGEPRPIDSTEIARHQSEDERRAGYAAYSTGDIDAALARFQAAVDAKPDDAEARNNLGQVMTRQKRAAEALPHFDEAIRLDPQKWAYRFNRARAHAELNQFPEAIADYRASADLFPEDYATHYNLGLVYMRTKQYPEAVGSLERAVSLAPGEASFLISLGTAYVGVEQPDKAREAFVKFLEVAADDDPEVPRVKDLIQALDAARPGT